MVIKQPPGFPATFSQIPSDEADISGIIFLAIFYYSGSAWLVVRTVFVRVSVYAATTREAGK